MQYKQEDKKAQSLQQQQSSPIVQFLRSLFKNNSSQYVLPQVLDIAKIDKIMDKSFLATLEYQYEKFLEANMQILDLYNVIDYLLDVRDAILLKLNRMIREEKMKKYTEGFYKPNMEQEAKNKTKILIEYRCGCQNLIHSTSFKGSTKNNSSRHHCLVHLKLLKTQNYLETELTNIKEELNDSTARHNIRSINYCK